MQAQSVGGKYQADLIEDTRVATDLQKAELADDRHSREQALRQQMFEAMDLEDNKPSR